MLITVDGPVLLRPGTLIMDPKDSPVLKFSRSTLQLEFKYLSEITGNPIYWEKVTKVSKAILSRVGVNSRLTVMS